MNSPTDSFTDDLASRATVKTYGDISIITIPDLEALSDFEQIAIFKKAELRLISGPLDPHALRSITPPPDQEEDDKESRLFEAQAREDLESDGCLVCYPPHLDIPVRNPPEEYRPIVDYWRSFSSTGDVVFCAQRADWRSFRTFQVRVRGHYPNELFSTYVDEVCKRRQRHGLGGDVHLLLYPQQQSQQENWVEFQNYHLQRHERLEKKREGLKEKLNGAQKNAGNTNMVESERAAQNKNAIQRGLEYAEQTLRWHEVILEWIEQQRLLMDLRSPTTVKEDSDDQNAVLEAAQKIFTRRHRSRQRDTSVVLGKVRVVKSTPKSPNTRIQTVEDSEPRPIIVDLNATRPSSIQQLLRRRETKSRHAPETSLGQLHPQRVAKVKRLADAGTNSRPESQRCGAGKTLDRAQPPCQSATQRMYPAPGGVEIRSGRISKPPVRWTPE